MVVIVSSDTPLESPIGPDRTPRRKRQDDEIVLLLTEAALPLSVLEVEEGVAYEGRSVRVGE
jgi:hypothetical protein